MLFKDVVGQQELKTDLPKLLQENRLAHALFFLGKEGSGALPLALAFAQYLVCENNHLHKKPDPGPSLFGEALPEAPVLVPTDACGVCAACIKAAALTHPDIHYTYPVVTKKSGTPPLSTDYITEWRQFIKDAPYGNVYDWLQSIGAENKQGNITAAECNELIKKLSLKTFESPYKILILWLPEYLGNEGNKLLKLIEEPPADTIFILVAENEAAVLATILSRCQMVKVPLLENTAVKEALEAWYGVRPEIAFTLAAQSQGNFREAIHLTQHAGADWQAMLREWLNSILRMGPMAHVKWVEETGKLGREQQKQFLQYFNHLLQQAVRLSVLGHQVAGTISETDLDLAQRINKIAAIEQLQAITEELDKAAYYIERNANGKLVFMALTIKIYHIIQNKVVLLNE